MRKLYLPISLFGLLFLVASCDFEPKDVNFFVLEDHEGWSNSRNLKANDINNTHISFGKGNKTMECSTKNLYCKDKDSLQYYTIERKVDSWYPIYTHRNDGRTDTLYVWDHEKWGSRVIDVGHISRWAKLKNWLVLETKLPGEILEHTHLNREEHLGRNIYDLQMCHYTYKGQKMVFDSNRVYYWIASRRSTHLYGPFSEKELKKKLAELQIQLPVTLNGCYDRYIHGDNPDADVFQTEPKEFYFPHHRSREDKIIK